ncbi:hypothetical protein FAF44_24200 [Nonomuraea sp. MG754425]|uniref:hypothetical protein n=1 Tax=Nonomuraea sp. MG754425 TaxID=2570319 RepID=UPI001F454C1B|nr:hypothetical protein [Nonomuraea sp. MG754425]MCF6471470.1 hypothetical protein [Nonomuraea sp. MG754425]
MIKVQTDASLSNEKPGRRIAFAGVIGIILPIALLAWVALMARLFPDSPQCGEYIGCFGYLAQAWEVGRWVAVVLAWPLLHLLRVRPSWPVAILAALFLTAIWQVAEALLLVSPAEAFALIIFGGVIAYPAAAWLVMPRIPRKLLILAVTSSLALYACAFLLTD